VARDSLFGRNRELWYALLVIILVTAGYSTYIASAGLLPASSGLLGHGIGVLGFVLMLMTETLYTLRKRAKSARWGRVAAWLRFHVFTGLVGSYMVLLHPAMRFRGLAGVLAVLTVVVAASGIVGRYVYTRVPRTVSVVDTRRPAQPAPGETPLALTLAADEDLDRRAARAAAIRKRIATWRAVHVPLTFVLFLVAIVHIVGAVYYATLLR
jgi:hypothetical protein